MSEIDWSILRQTPALDPVTSLHYGAVQDAQRNADALARQKFAAAQQQQQADAAAYSKAAADFRAGNLQAAQADLIGTGNSDMVNAGNSSGKTTFDQHTTGLQAVGGFAKYVMDHVPDPADRAAVIQHNAPLLIAAGAHPEDLQAVAANPTDAVLGGIAAQYYSPKDQDAAAVAQQNADNSQHETAIRDRAETRLEQTPVGISTTDNVYLPGGASPAATAGAPASGGSAADNSRAARNNNPGNLRWDGHSQWQGVTGVDPQGFVVFDTPANGQRALGINIANQQKLHGINTIAGLINKFAPASDNNDPAGYAQRVARQLGVGVNDPVNLADPHVQQVVSRAITGVEAGGTPAKFAQDAPHGPTLIQAGIPKPQATDMDPSDPGVELAARQYAITGEMPPLGNGSGPMRRAIISRAAQIVQENGWTPAQIAANKAQYKARTGNLAKLEQMRGVAATAEQTALANGQTYLDQSAHVTGQTSYPIINGIVNAYHREVGDPDIQGMDTAYQTFVTEYAKVVTASPSGSGQLSDSAREENMDILRSSAAPAQKRRAFSVMKKDMANRMDAIDAQIEREQNGIANMGSSSARQSTPHVSATKSVGGKTYYQIGGDWFDNAEGR